MAQQARDLVPNIVDYQAIINPDGIYAEYPISEWSYEEGYRTITRRDLANAVNGIAWWLQDKLGLGEGNETLAYIGPNDLRYIALVIGAVKAGYLMLLTSPRNSVPAHLNLFDRLDCKVILSPDPQPASTKAILASRQLRVEYVPSVDCLLTSDYPPFPYDKTFCKAGSEPLVAIHTSGSTGMPKPLVYTHDTAARVATMMALEPPSGSRSQHLIHRGKRVFATFPPFHAAFLNIHLSAAVSLGTTVIHPLSGPIPSAEGLVEGLKKSPAKAAFVPPSFIKDISENPRLLDFCAENLDLLFYGGGDLPQSLGDKVASRVMLANQFGASEMGMTAHLLADNRHREDWKYIQFHPGLGMEFKHVIDDLHELHVKHDPKKEPQQPPFTLFPHAEDFTCHDLFSPHPSPEKRNLWNWRGRADDVIVFLNGEKTNPILMEQHIASSPLVGAALVVGAQRFQAALLLEPAVNDKERSKPEQAALIEDVWPWIDESNQKCPKHAKIMKSHIMFTKPRKPMLRTPKGTVQRFSTLKLYEDDINALYHHLDDMTAQRDGQVPNVSDRIDETSMPDFLRRVILDVTEQRSLHDSDNLFDRGLDSLQALMISRRLNQGLGTSSIAPSTLYSNPSIDTLVDAILSLLRESDTSTKTEKANRQKERAGVLKEYQGIIDRISIPQDKPVKSADNVVVLTGSTGALGSYILHTLLQQPIAHIYCLNRAKDSQNLQRDRNRSRGLPTQFDASRVTFLTAALDQVSLGLESETYNELSNRASLIIHNAWPVNFNLPLTSFKSQLNGLTNLMTFATAAAHSPHLFFLSSISSIMSHRTPSLKTLEEVISTEADTPNGYAESKYISEHLLAHAAKHLPLSVSFARVGQVAGAADFAGIWNKAEWFPSLVLSSKHVGVVPESLGTTLGRVDWVPIDMLAQVLVELAVDCSQPEKSNENSKVPAVFHPLNPQPTAWEAVRDVLIDELTTSSAGLETEKEPMQTIPLRSWLAKVRKDMEANTTNSCGEKVKDEDLAACVERNPAIKLLDFFEDVLSKGCEESNVLEIERTLERSGKLRDVEGVKGEWIRKWVREWVASMG